jgi:DNA-binding MarR family transcriptional regulator
MGMLEGAPNSYNFDKHLVYPGLDRILVYLSRGPVTDALPSANTGMLLSAAFRAFVTQLHDCLAAAGYPDIRPAHTHVFQWIGASGARVADMAEHAQLTKQAMAQLVDDLEQRGYLERQPDPDDRRAKIVRLTEAGWAVVRVGLACIESIEHTWARQLGPDQMHALRAMLADLGAHRRS